MMKYRVDFRGPDGTLLKTEEVSVHHLMRVLEDHIRISVPGVTITVSQVE